MEFANQLNPKAKAIKLKLWTVPKHKERSEISKTKSIKKTPENKNPDMDDMHKKLKMHI